MRDSRGGPFSDDLHRWLEATDSLGDTEHLEIRSRLQASQPGEPISPVRMLTLHRDKRAWKQGGRDHTKARVFKWMLRGTHVVSGVLYKEKPPLEYEIVYTYPGDQPSPDLLRSQAQGADGLPTAVSRTLEDGSVQTHQFAYTERGYVSKFVDPAGRMFSLFYASNGNLLSDGERTFEWDARDRLVAINMGDHRSEFHYDGFDRRVRIVEKERDAVMSDVWLLWCGDVICEQRVMLGDTSRPQKQFFNFGETDGERAYFYTHDHLGSIRQMIDAAGAVVASYDYDPYGHMRRVQDAGTATFGYAGYFWHAASNVSLMRFRAYDPHLGRWLSRDLIAEAGGSNLYGYVENNPINLVDPLGLQVSWPDWLKPKLKLPTLSPRDVLPLDDLGIIKAAPLAHQYLWRK